MNPYIISIILTIAAVFLLWHWDVNQNLGKLGVKQTSGVFRIPPYTACKLSQYGLILIVFLFNLLVISQAR